MMVNTVLGPISPDSMGRTLVHDHFTFGYPGYPADLTMAPYDHEVELRRCLKVCDTLNEIGVKTVLDPTPNDCHGRNPELMKEVSSKTGINIICTTGLYTEKEGAPHYWLTMLTFGKDITKMITELFIKEINEGIWKTGVKAGAIKIGSSPILTDYEKTVHLAAVNAQKATGVPIVTHTDGPSGGVEQAEFLLSQGADPRKLMIGHVNNSDDVNYHRAILQKGSSIGFDRMGLAAVFGFTEEDNCRNIAQLIKEGYGNRIMMSQDSVISLGRDRFADLNENDSRMLKDYRIDFICKDAIPMLKAEGITEQQINNMMIDNPKNLFLGV